ncbi:MAG: polysaccharide pyruvyl transferase family protein [Desulfuromonadaceae bacterium]|nr:polysaccharide pyruvyl transferase family protein [Desulfuromonadaceae bacterium]
MSRIVKIILLPWRKIFRPMLRAAALVVGVRQCAKVIDRDRLRVLIAGGYGYGNVGDEAQLAANLQHWRRLKPNCQLTVLTPDLAYTQKAHDGVRVELAPRKSLFGWRGRQYCGHDKNFKLCYFPIAVLCLINATLVRAGLPTFFLTAAQARLLDELSHSDVLFLSGGGYLTGMTLTRLWDNMLLIRLAHIFGVPTILSGQTVGVFNDRISRFLAHWGLKKAESIYLRDPIESPAALAAIGIPAQRYKSTFDDALFYEAAPVIKVNEILTDSGVDLARPYIAVNVHYWGQKPEDSRTIMAGVAKVLDHICNEFSLQAVFVPMHQTDMPAIENTMQNMKTSAQRPDHDYRPDLAVGIIQRAVLCVTMKHHPIIFALAAAVPTVSMTFDPYYYHKNYGAMKIFNQEACLVHGTAENVDSDLLVAMEKTFLSRDKRSREIAAAVDAMRPMSGEVIEKFVKNGNFH